MSNVADVCSITFCISLCSRILAIMCISISIHIATFVCVLLYIPTFITSEEACTFTYLGETKQLTGLCSWSAWLPWNCTCCGNKINLNVTRKRAICCSKGVDMPTCLNKCNYTGENATDTRHGTCKDGCAEKYNQTISYPCRSLARISSHVTPASMSTLKSADSSPTSVTTSVSKSFAISSSPKLSSTVILLPLSVTSANTWTDASSTYFTTVRESMAVLSSFNVQPTVRSQPPTPTLIGSEVRPLRTTPTLIGSTVTPLQTISREPLETTKSSVMSPISGSSASSYTSVMVDRQSTQHSIRKSMQTSTSVTMSSETALSLGVSVSVGTDISSSFSFSLPWYPQTMTTSVIETMNPSPPSTVIGTSSGASLFSSERRSYVTSAVSTPLQSSIASSYTTIDITRKSEILSVNSQNRFSHSSVPVKNRLTFSQSRGTIRTSMTVDQSASTTAALRTPELQIHVQTKLIESGSHTQFSSLITASAVPASSILLHLPIYSLQTYTTNGLSTDINMTEHSQCMTSCTGHQGQPKTKYQDCVQKCSERFAPQATRDEENDSHRGNAGVIAGSVIGSLVAIAVLVGAVVLLKHRMKQGQKVAPAENQNPETFDEDSVGETSTAQRTLGMVDMKAEGSTYIKLPPIDTSHS